jgi:hypothetical protein
MASGTMVCGMAKAKKTKPREHLFRWRISLIKGTPAKFIGFVRLVAIREELKLRRSASQSPLQGARRINICQRTGATTGPAHDHCSEIQYAPQNGLTNNNTCHFVDVDLDSAVPNKSPLENDPMIGDRDLGCPRVNCHESG